MSRHALLSASLLLALGCTTDALYTYCDRASQCGSRRYGEDDDAYTVSLRCVDVDVQVTASRRAVGSFCTLACEADFDCDSRIGIGRGACVQWEGDDAAWCYQRCEDDAQCYPSSACERILLDGEPLGVCLPRRSPG